MRVLANVVCSASECTMTSECDASCDPGLSWYTTGRFRLTWTEECLEVFTSLVSLRSWAAMPMLSS